MGVKARLKAGKANTGADRYGYQRIGDRIVVLESRSVLGKADLCLVYQWRSNDGTSPKVDCCQRTSEGEQYSKAYPVGSFKYSVNSEFGQGICIWYQNSAPKGRSFSNTG